MADEAISDEDFYKYFRTYLSAKYHPLVEKYGEVLSQAMACKGEAKEWRKEFDKLETNFDRVFFILKALECFNREEKGIGVLGLPPTKESNKLLTNGKSDAIARKCLSISDKFYRERKLMRALVALNRAYFSAVSKEIKFDILLKRIRLIKKFDVDEVLEEEMDFILKNKTTDENTQTVDSLRDDIERIIDFQVCQGHWISEYPDLPKSLNGKTPDNPVTMQEDKFKVVPTSDGSKQSRSENSETKYTVVASKDISIGRTQIHFRLACSNPILGEVILSEKPYASVLNRPYSSICYNCYKRCINIRPCQGCAYVGFCSDKCADEARNPTSSINGGPGRHVHDCGGILPCLRLDDLFDEETINYQGLAHLGFICVANTPAHILLNNICSSSSNKNQQGFECTGNSSVHKSSDYSFIVRGRSSVGMPPKNIIWKCTVVAVFLTYCLSITGYPMKWFTEAKEHFYSQPSSTNQPDWLPASWIAAQLISHLATNNFNAKEYVEYYEEKEELSSNTNWIANCIYPIISLVSHDCNPTACIVNTAHGCAFLYALRSIKKGETISLTYGTFYFVDSSALSRKRFLQHVYSFNCSCEACRNDWCLNKRGDFEILKCPLCESSFKSIKEKCLSCKKASGYWMYQKILHEKIPFLTSALKYDSGIGRECASEVISAMEEVQRLISSPSPTVAIVLSQGMQIIERTCGIRFTLLT